MNPYVQVILENLLPVFATVLTAVLPVLLTYGIHTFAKRTGLQISEAQANKVEMALEYGIKYAEEWAHQKTKADPLARPAGAEKLDKALEYVQTEMKRTGVQELAADELKRLLLARLGMSR